jgi:exonuclease SbcC
MIPIKLTIEGFLSYRDPVAVDFTRFKLACISGANGAGKSSLLDAITWALFGKARARDDELINSGSSLARVQFDFHYEGSDYQVMRTKKRDKTTQLELRILTPEGTPRVLTEATLRLTEQRIQDVLRLDYETFTNASFFLQGRADQFAQQRPAERKQILGSILGLDIWERYREQAQLRRRHAEADLAGLDAQLQEIEAELAQEADRRSRLQALESQLEQLTASRQSQQTILEQLRLRAASLAEQRRLVDLLAGQAAAAGQRVAAISRQLDDRLVEQTRHQQQLAQAAEIHAAEQTWQAARTELERWDGLAASFHQMEQRRGAPRLVIAAERSRLDEERRSLRRQQADAAELGAQLPQLAAQLAALDIRLADHQARLAGRGTLEEKLRLLIQGQADAQAENRSLKSEMDQLKERIDRLKAASGADCPLCGQPLGPAERAQLIADLEAGGAEMGTRYRQNTADGRRAQEDQRVLEAELAALRQLETEAVRLDKQRAQLESSHQQLTAALAAWEQGGAVRLQEVDQLLAEESFAPAERAELARVDAELKTLGYDAAAHDAVRQAEQAGRTSQVQARELAAAQAALGPLEREIAGLQQQLAAGRAEAEAQAEAHQTAAARLERDMAGMPDLDDVEAAFFRLQEQENQLRMQVGGARQAVEVLAVLRERKLAKTEDRESQARQVELLRKLERTFGKDGLPARLIENALPELQEQANRILEQLSGGTMTVEFHTQRDFRDARREDKKETLDILIRDETGAAREYELFSGGEAFRVNFAIRLALSRVLAQRAGSRLQLLVIDEGFGSQDTAGRTRLVQAINLVRDDFACILVITHLEELKDAFPARIEVEKGPGGSRAQVLVL